jgi:hypothetical protein
MTRVLGVLVPMLFTVTVELLVAVAAWKPMKASCTVIGMNPSTHAVGVCQSVGPPPAGRKTSWGSV